MTNGVPHKTESIKDGGIGIGRVRGAKGQYSDKDEECAEEECWHSPSAEPFNAFVNSTIDKNKVYGEAEEQKGKAALCELAKNTKVAACGVLVFGNNACKMEKIVLNGLNACIDFSICGGGLLCGGHNGLHATGPIFPRISEAPCFNGDIPHIYDNGND